MPARSFQPARLAAAIALAAFLLLGGAIPSASEAAFPGKPGRIAFFFDPAGMSGPELYSVSPSGGAATPLTGNGVNVYDAEAAYAADGRRILFSQFDDDTDVNRIVIMNADGSGQDPLITSTPSFIGSPAFAPSGRTFAYVCTISGGYAVCSSTVTGGALPPIVDDPTLNDTDPAYARDGRLFFTRPGDVSGNEIWVRLRNVTERQLTENSLQDRAANPSPDGRWVTFEREGDIWLMRSDGSGQRNLTNSPGSDQQPAFSPTGRQIAFKSGSRLAVMSASGGPLTFLTPSADFASQPDWQPIPVKCGSKRATQVGTAGRDTLVGTPQRDVLAGLGGSDVLKGKGRNDVLCGGDGPDRLIAGAGRRDRCIGGKAPDLARRCEVERSI